MFKVIQFHHCLRSYSSIVWENLFVVEIHVDKLILKSLRLNISFSRFATLSSCYTNKCHCAVAEGGLCHCTVAEGGLCHCTVAEGGLCHCTDAEGGLCHYTVAEGGL